MDHLDESLQQIHNTTWGLICPAETPEGQPVGLVKNMAILAHVTVGYEENFLLEQLAGMAGWCDTRELGRQIEEEETEITGVESSLGGQLAAAGRQRPEQTVHIIYSPGRGRGLGGGAQTAIVGETARRGGEPVCWCPPAAGGLRDVRAHGV